MDNVIWNQCPICGSKDYEEKNGIAHCHNCGHGFRTVVPVKIKEHYFAKSYWNQDKNRQGMLSIDPDDNWKEWVGGRMNILESFGLVEKECKPRNSKRIFEFGCAEGMMLYELKKRGYDVMGNEVGEIADESIEKLGIPISKLPIEEFVMQDERFDLIMSFHVVEHLIDPKSLFKSLANMLNPHGYILLHVPVNDAEYDNMDHFHFFSDESCRRLMETVTKDVRSDFVQYNISSAVQASAGTYVGEKK